MRLPSIDDRWAFTRVQCVLKKHSEFYEKHLKFQISASYTLLKLVKISMIWVMKIPKDELIAILSPFNPWWRKENTPDLPQWKRSTFHEL